MLQTDAIDPKILGLIKQLQSIPCLKRFHLVGGTALALYLGHRKSVDIDLFSITSFDEQMLLEILTHETGFTLHFSAKNTIKGSIEGIKTDIIAHRYPLIGDAISEQDISLVSIPDIIAIKLNDISLSGQRVKDFIDIYFLLDQYPVREMLAFYRKKYSLQNDTLVLKSLVWFEDADLADWPVMIEEPRLSWSKVRKRLIRAVKDF